MEQTMTTYQTICVFCNAKRRTGENFTIKMAHSHLKSYGMQISYAYVYNVIKALRLAGYVIRLDIGVYMCINNVPSDLTLTKLNKIAYPVFKYGQDTYEVSVFTQILQQNVCVEVSKFYKDAVRQLEMQHENDMLFVSFKVDVAKLKCWPKQCYIDVLSNDKLAYDKVVRSLKFEFE